MVWSPVSTQADADRLLDLFGGFHDSCIREAHMWTEAFVTPDLCMNCSFDLDSRIRLLIQRQFRTPSAIELLFEGVIAFYFQPTPVGCSPDISDATILYEDETFYWAAFAGWLPTSDNRDETTWIAARNLSWRDTSHWMGSELRYRSADNS